MESVETKKRSWAGIVVSALPVLFLLMDAVMKLVKAEPVIAGTVELGYQESVILPLGIVLLIGVILYIIPKTAIFGAVLLTAYLGGAVATHVRIGNPLFTHILFPVYLGILLWLGLYLRDVRLRELVPILNAPLTAAGSPKWMTIVGWTLTIIATLMLVMSAAFKFLKVPQAVEGMQKFGWDESKLLMLGILEIGSLIVYLFPKTRVLGAIILAGYLGGAVATHFRVGDVIWGPIMVGVFVWLGLWLREPRLRALTPLRS